MQKTISTSQLLQSLRKTLAPAITKILRYDPYAFVICRCKDVNEFVPDFKCLISKDFPSLNDNDSVVIAKDEDGIAIIASMCFELKPGAAISSERVIAEIVLNRLKSLTRVKYEVLNHKANGGVVLLRSDFYRDKSKWAA